MDVQKRYSGTELISTSALTNGCSKRDFISEPNKKSIFNQGIIQRLYSQPVPCKEQCFILVIPDRECEHSVKFMDTFRTIFFKGMNNNFGITVSFKLMSFLRKNRFDIAMIINLPVISNPVSAVFVRHRLMTAAEINY